MAYNNNNGANNWFGQVGAGPGRTMQSRQQVTAPALSQIPGLSKATGDLSLNDPPKQLFRDTDSAYVRLAKQGGRSDLLRMDQDPLPASHASEQRSLPDWMQKDLMNGDGVNDRKHVNCSQNSNFLPPISETRASYSNTKTPEKNGVSSHHSAKPAGRNVTSQSEMLAERRRLSRNTAADFHSQGEKPRHLTGQELAAVNYSQDHRKIPESSAEFCERLYNQDSKPALSNAEGKTDHVTANKSMPNPSRHVNSAKPGDAAQCQSRGELEDINYGKTQYNGNNLESSACDDFSAKWLPQDSDPSNGKENFAYPGDDDLLNGYNPEKLEARRGNFMPDDQYSVSDWSRKTSAEGGRQYNQPEFEPDYPGRYPDNGNWQDDQIEPSLQRRPPSPAAAGVSSGPRSSDPGRPEWLQPSPHADGQRDRSSVRGVEDNLDEQYSPTRRRFSGQSSTTQRPFADHGYPLPMTTETSSAFSDKQLPAGNSRQSPLKSSDQMSNYKADFQTTHQKQFPPASDHQTSAANRMKRSDSMSKLLSFGYLRDAENEPLKSRTPSHPRIDNSYLTDPYRTEYKDKMYSGTGTATKAPQAEPAYVPTLISDPSHRRRKQSVEERPEFFRIGSTDSQSLLAHNSYKPVAEARSEVFANDRIANTNAVGYGKTKHVPENKPDFFTIGSLDNYLDRQEVQPSGDGGGIMDRLNGYGIAPKSNFRRRKTDFNAPVMTKPVKAVSRF